MTRLARIAGAALVIAAAHADEREDAAIHGARDPLADADVCAGDSLDEGDHGSKGHFRSARLRLVPGA